MRRSKEVRCVSPSGLPLKIGGATRRRWGDASIHRYRSEYTRAGEYPILVRVATYMGHCVNLY